MRITEHFQDFEFQCNCCEKNGVQFTFIDKLEKSRVRAGIPFKITSGYRCSDKQKSLKKQGYETASGVSPHEKGVAVDIACNSGRARYVIMESLMNVGFNRFGIGSNFLHVDKDRDRPKDVVWHYKR